MDNQEWQRCIDILDAFYRALNDGDFEGAYDYLSRRDKRFLTLKQFVSDREEDISPETWTLAPSRAVSRTIIKENPKASETVSLAYVRVRMAGSGRFDALMIKENEEWKVYFQSDIPRHVWQETSDDGAVETWRILPS